VSSRDRTIATALLAAVIVVAGGFVFYQFYLVPLGEREQKILLTREAVQKKKQHKEEVDKERAMVAQWSKLSLPGDLFSSQRMYQLFLEGLISQSRIANASMEVKNVSTTTGAAARGPGYGTNKEPFYTPLKFTVTGRTDLSHLLQLLSNFYSQPLLHRIQVVSITRPKGSSNPKSGDAAHSSRDLEISLDIEALIVKGTPPRETILPTTAVEVRNLARPPSEYMAMDKSNIFYGPPPPPPKVSEGADPAASVKLTSITTNLEGDRMVTLCDADQNMWLLYPDRKKDPKDIFEIKNKNDAVKYQGEVTRVDSADIVFRVGEKYYSMHIGNSVAEAMRKPLTEAQVKAMQPTQTPANHPIRTPEDDAQ
jgi:hypothetical protein